MQKKEHRKKRMQMKLTLKIKITLNVNVNIRKIKKSALPNITFILNIILENRIIFLWIWA